MSTRGLTWNRELRVSKKPDKQRGLYYFAVRDGDTGKPRRVFLENEREPSMRILAALVAAGLERQVRGRVTQQALSNIVRESELGNGPAGVMLATQTRSKPGAQPGGLAKPNEPSFLPHSFTALVLACIQKEEEREWRGEGMPPKGWIGGRTVDENVAQFEDILRFFQKRFGDTRCQASRFGDLIRIDDYESMLRHFSGERKLKASPFVKRRHRFWQLAKYAARHPEYGPLAFAQFAAENVGPSEERVERELPTVETLQAILGKANLTQQFWIWLAIGTGFHGKDLADLTPKDITETSYNFRRSKSKKRFARYGGTHRLIASYLRAYLKKNPRQPGERLFLTRFGNPYVQDRRKTPEEIENGTATRKASKRRTARTDNFRDEWTELKQAAGIKEWKGGGFLILRHIGATVLATQPGVNLVLMKRFLGHSVSSDVANRYIEEVPPGSERLTDWIKRMLDGKSITAWKKLA